MIGIKHSCFGGGAEGGHLRRLLPNTNTAHSPAMTEDLEATILAFLKRAPEWVRRDLTAKDQSARTLAEEAFAAMLADALRRAES